MTFINKKHLPIFFFFKKNSPVSNVIGFFLTGLPGGLDYFFLILVKLGKMEKLREKRYSTRLNVWLRGPGALSASFMLYIICLDPVNRSDYTHWYTPWACMIVSMLCFVNSQFYLLQVSFVFRFDCVL